MPVFRGGAEGVRGLTIESSIQEKCMFRNVAGRIVLPVAALCASAMVQATVLSSGGVGIPVEPPGARALGAGGLSVAMADAFSSDSPNPASLFMIRTTRLAVHFLSERQNLTDAGGSTRAAFANFNGFRFILPMGRGFGTSAGLEPWTRVDYRLSFNGTLDGEPYSKAVSASGGLNAATGSAWWSFRNVLSAGLSGHYLFGRLDEAWNIRYSGAGFTAVEHSLSTRLHGIGLTAGLAARPVPRLTLGAIFRPGVRLTAKNDSQSNSRTVAAESTGSVDLPAMWTIGASAVVTGRLSLGAEYGGETWTRLRVNGNRPSALNDAYHFSVGAELLSSTLPADPFWSRAAFRAGARFQRFYLQDPDGGAVAEIMGTLGFGIPLASSGSFIDVACGIGRRGSLSANGFRENVFRVAVSATLAERWFVQ
jgi:hypothetical protein